MPNPPLKNYLLLETDYDLSENSEFFLVVNCLNSISFVLKNGIESFIYYVYSILSIFLYLFVQSLSRIKGVA